MVLVGVLGALVEWAEPASASCHQFTVAVSPESVTEGRTVTVTVTRDGAEAPSSVTVRTIAGSASAPGDFEPLDETVNFKDDTSRELKVAVADDGVAEGEETFRVGLSDPSGCVADTDYALSADASVTIVDTGARLGQAGAGQSGTASEQARPDSVPGLGEPGELERALAEARAASRNASGSPAAGGSSNAPGTSGSSARDQSDEGPPLVPSFVITLSALATILVAWFLLRRQPEGDPKTR